MSETNPYVDIARLVAAGIVGGLVATIAAHYLAISRDKASGRATRKRDFLVFMKAWRGDFERPRYGSGSESAAPTIFIDGLIAWHGYVALISGDFTGASKIKFDELVAVVPKCYVHDHKKISKAMADVIEFVETAA